MLRGLLTLTACSMFLVAASATRAQELDQQVVLTDPSVRDAAVQSGPAYDPSSILVRFKDTARASDKAAARALVAGAVKRRFHLVPGLEHIRIGNGMSVESAIKALERRPFVAYAEPNYSVHLAEAVPDDYWFAELWGLDNWGQASSFGDFASGIAGADIKALQAWAAASGNNVVVAILDTGIDYNHADLNPNMWINSDEFIEPPHYKDTDDDHNGFVDDIRGWDFYNDDNDPFDDNGHGTHVAGIIGAVRNNGIGTVGVAPNVKLMPVKFLDLHGNGDDALSIVALEYAVDNGARVSNHSYFLDAYSQALYDAIKAAGDHGHLVVASAGNDGLNVDSWLFKPFRRYPASYDLPNVISVTATDNSNQRAVFSNVGPVSVDLGAPGVAILSSFSSLDEDDPFCCYWMFKDGTSMATAFVTGVAALVMELRPGWTASQVKNCILNTVNTAHTESLQGKTLTGGVVDAAAAVACAGTSGGENNPPLAADDVASTDQGVAVTIDVLSNDYDPDGDPLVISSVTQGEHGSTAITDGGQTVTYTPSPDYSGSDRFNYFVSDGTATAEAMVTVTVNSTNRPPVANPDSASTDQGVAVVIDVLSNDSDPDGDPLVISSVTQGEHGSTAITDSGQRVTYTPSPDYSGPDTFNYFVSDGTAAAEATVTVTVQASVTLVPSSVNEGGTWTARVETSDGSSLNGTWSSSGVGVPSCAGDSCSLSNIKKKVGSVVFTSSFGTTAGMSVTVTKP